MTFHLIQGLSVPGEKGEPGRSFLAELEELQLLEGSGDSDLFSMIPGLENLRGPKGTRSSSYCSAALVIL